jgi:hypothetical protein
MAITATYAEQKAYKAAVRLIQARLKALAWDRNACVKLRATYPQAVAAAKEYEELEGALAVFQALLPQPAKRSKPGPARPAKPQELTYEELD